MYRAHRSNMTWLSSQSIMRLSWLAAVSSLVFAVTSPAFATEPREFILSNGMKVLLVEVPKAPVATVQVWYKVGSRNEVMGRAGLSHMLEHMMFKGTIKYPKGAFSRLIRKNGGTDNARRSGSPMVSLALFSTSNRTSSSWTGRST